MARPICPSCGKPYNGKRCKACLYENFSEELSHRLHTHAGEPLVVADTARKPIPRKDPFGCEKRSKKRKVRPWVLLAVILVLLEPAASLLYGVVSEVRETVSLAAEPDSTLPANGTTLYDGNGLLVTADWRDGQEYADGFTIALRNTTGQDLALYATEVVVNGYLMDDAFFYCDVRQGHTSQGEFYLDEEELSNAGIETVQTLSFCLTAYDPDSYETVAEIGPFPLKAKAIPGFVQPDADQGEMLYEGEGLRVVCRGYQPSRYEQEVSSGTLLLYLENTTDRPVDIYLLEATVNGEKVNLGLWRSLPAQTRTVAQMYLFDLEDLDLHHWEQITDMTLLLEAADPDGDTVSIGPVSISPAG